MLKSKEIQKILTLYRSHFSYAIWEPRGLLPDYYELVRIGYAEASKELTSFLYRNPELRAKYGKFGQGLKVNRSDRKYTNLQFFGRHTFIFYFSLENKGPFETFLSNRFAKFNPSPKVGLTTAFRQELHGMDLHPDGCAHKMDAIPQKGGGIKRGTPNVHSRKNLTAQDLEKLWKLFA